MKKRMIFTAVLLLFCFIVLAGCDPIYPMGNLKVAQIDVLSQGDSKDIGIIYPNTGGSIVKGWKDQKAEIISGEDIVAVDGLTVTGLKAGTALVKISATTIIPDEAVSVGNKERTYFIKVKIKVK
jgi:hypothetical protein